MFKEGVTSSDRQSGIRKLIALYATRFKHTTGKDIKVLFTGRCCVNMVTGVIELPDVVGYKSEEDKKFKERMLIFGAQHEMGHLISTDLEAIEPWMNKVKGSKASAFLHQCINVFEDIREEHLFCGHFPGAGTEMRDFLSQECKRELSGRFRDPKCPMTKKLMDLSYVRGRSLQYEAYGLDPVDLKVPDDVEEAYQKTAADLVVRASKTESQDEICKIAYEFYTRVKEESDKPSMPPLNVGDVVACGKEIGQVLSITGNDVEVEVITKEEAKKRLAS